MALTTSAPSPSDARLERNGQLVLFAVFVSLLGGRFTLQQVSSGLPDVDLRWVAFAASLVAFLGWVAVARERAAPRVDLHGLTAPFLAWCSWMALSALWAHPPARVAAGFLDFTFLAAFTLLGIAIASRLSAEAVAAVWTWMLVAGLVYFAGAMAGSPDAQGEYAAFGGGPNVFVRVMMLAALAAAYLGRLVGTGWSTCWRCHLYCWVRCCPDREVASWRVSLSACWEESSSSGGCHCERSHSAS